MNTAIPRLGRRPWPSFGPILALVVAASAVSGAGFFVYQKLNPGTPPITQQRDRVARGSIAATVSATGSVAAPATSRLSFRSTGRVADVRVAVGDSVAGGQVLARLDTSELELAVQQARAGVAANQAKLDQMLAGARPEDVTVAEATLAAARAKLVGMQESRPEEITAARVSLEAAQAKLAAMLAGSRPEEVDSAQVAVESALAKLRQVRAGALDAEIVAARTTLESAQSNLRSSEVKLAELLRGPLPADIASAQSAIDTARSNLASAQVRLDDLRTSVTPMDVAAARVGVDNARTTLQTAQIKVDQLRAGANAADLASAEAAVTSAESNLRAARAKLVADRACITNPTSCQTTGQRGAPQIPTSDQLASDQSAVDAAEANLRSAQAKLDQLKQGSSTADIAAAETAVAAARAGLNSAQLKLDDVVAGPSPLDIAGAQAGVDAGRAGLVSAEAKYAELMNPTNTADIAAARAAVEAGQASVRAAEAKLQQVLAGPEEADLVAAESSLIQAQNNLNLKVSPYTDADVLAQEQAIRQAEANLALKLIPSAPADLEAQRQAVRQAEASLALKRAPYVAADIAAAVAAVDQSQASLAAALSNLEGGTIVAPFSGVISVVNLNVGESSSGASASTTSTSTTSGGGITIVDPSRVRVDVQVDESDIARIAVGQPATLTFDALPGSRFPAAVTAIAPSGTTSQGVVGYQVSMELQRPSEAPPGADAEGVRRLPPGVDPQQARAARQARQGADGQTTPGPRPGMTAVAEITYAQRDDVLVMPNRAITRQGRDRFVQVVTANGMESRKVEVGMANDQLTEITGGDVKEGEEVVIPTTTARAAIPGARQQGGFSGPGAAPGGAFIAPAPAGPAGR